MFKKIYKDKRTWIILISGLIIGLITHGMMLFNKYSFHDDAGSFNHLGSTWKLGRWGLGVFEYLIPKYNGSRLVSIPLFNGIETILFVLLTVIILVYALDIKSTKSIILLTGMFVSFPTITGIFGYMFTAPYYYLGTLLGILGASLFHKYKNVLSFIICTLLMAFGTSLYQANIPVYIACLLLFMVKDIYESDYSFKEFFIYGFKQVAICITFMIEYFILNTIFLNITGIEMSEYKGIKDWGKTSIKEYIKRVIESYRQFFLPRDFVKFLYTL